ncbi:MAG: hypothetical protein COA84_10285 [Robiginitomaculum sp.]|nr:MAG: hypothetical protein COA84_10285 [Robiginitomaculum sp.]
MTKVAIEIEESTLKALQKVAKPLVDTYDTVIARLLGQEFKSDTAITETTSANIHTKPIHFSSDNPPNLTHTRVIRAQIEGQALPKANWNKLLSTLYGIAVKNNKDLKYLEALSAARTVAGIKTDNGYKPIAGNIISLQGVGSNDAWRFAADLARKLEKPVSIEFEWYNKKAAAYPGKAGVLSWPDAQNDPYLQSVSASLSEWNEEEDAQAYDKL